MSTNRKAGKLALAASARTDSKTTHRIEWRKKMAVVTAATCISLLCVATLNADVFGQLLPSDVAAEEGDASNAKRGAHVKPHHDDATVPGGNDETVDARALEKGAEGVERSKTHTPGLEKTMSDPINTDERLTEDGELKFNTKYPRELKRNKKKIKSDTKDLNENFKEKDETKPEARSTLEDQKSHSEKESWSDDGRVHCVEESPEVIKCHTHDELQEDGPVHVRPDSYRKVDADVSQEVVISGGQLEIKKKLSEKLSESSQIQLATGGEGEEENLHNNNILPPNSSSARQRTVVNLDYSNGVVKVIDSLTGEKKNVSELGGQEEVNTSSLMAVRKKKAAMTNKLVRQPKLKTLQEYLEYLREKNFPEIQIDFKRNETHELWPQDHICKGLVTRFGQSLRRVLLVSYPKSGSSWLRYLLEASTGVFTGSTYNSSVLYSLGFRGEAEPPGENTTLTLTTHSTSPLPGERSTSVGEDVGVPTVLIMRNPAQALVSLWQQANSERNGRPVETYASTEFQEFVRAELQRWEQTYAGRLLWSPQLHVVHYEDLRARPLQELLKVLVFLQLPPPAGQRLFCLRQYTNGPLGPPSHHVHPYSSEEQDAIWAAVTRVSGALKLRGLPLPPYHLPTNNYPPKRAGHMGKRKARHGNNEESGLKDEL